LAPTDSRSEDGSDGEAFGTGELEEGERKRIEGRGVLVFVQQL